MFSLIFAILWIFSLFFHTREINSSAKLSTKVHSLAGKLKGGRERRQKKGGKKKKRGPGSKSVLQISRANEPARDLHSLMTKDSG